MRALFNQYGYDVRPTGADASNQNGPVERSHQTIGNALRSMLSGAGLTAKFWPFAFQHFLRITNALRSAGRALSPYEMTHDRQDDFTRFRTFGSVSGSVPLVSALPTCAFTPVKEFFFPSSLAPPAVSSGSFCTPLASKLPNMHGPTKH